MRSCYQLSINNVDIWKTWEPMRPQAGQWLSFPHGCVGLKWNQLESRWVNWFQYFPCDKLLVTRIFSPQSVKMKGKNNMNKKIIKLGYTKFKVYGLCGVILTAALMMVLRYADEATTATPATETVATAIETQHRQLKQLLKLQRPTEATTAETPADNNWNTSYNRSNSSWTRLKWNTNHQYRCNWNH